MIMPCGTGVAHMFSVLGRWVAMFDYLLGGLVWEGKTDVRQETGHMSFGRLNAFRHGL